MAGFAAASLPMPSCRVIPFSWPVGQEEVGGDVLAREVAIDRLVEFEVELLVRDAQHVDAARPS